MNIHFFPNFAFFRSNSAIFLTNVDENVSEFHDKFKKMMKFIDIAIKSAEKIRESAENSGNRENYSFFRMNNSIQSLILAA